MSFKKIISEKKEAEAKKAMDITHFASYKILKELGFDEDKAQEGAHEFIALLSKVIDTNTPLKITATAQQIEELKAILKI